MRKLNIGLVLGILVTFLLHAITGAMQIAGGQSQTSKTIAWICVAFICAHIIVGMILTYQTLHACRMSHTNYFKGNELFWIRRISGLVIMIPLIMHLVIFRAHGDGNTYRVVAFTAGRLISQILLVASIALHVLTNIKPLMIGLGINDHRGYTIDVLLVLSVLLLLFAIAFFIYYLRWMAV